jgi:hypothetical protein
MMQNDQPWLTKLPVARRVRPHDRGNGSGDAVTPFALNLRTVGASSPSNAPHSLPEQRRDSHRNAGKTGAGRRSSGLLAGPEARIMAGADIDFDHNVSGA